MRSRPFHPPDPLSRPSLIIHRARCSRQRTRRPILAHPPRAPPVSSLRVVATPASSGTPPWSTLGNRSALPVTQTRPLGLLRVSRAAFLCFYRPQPSLRSTTHTVVVYPYSCRYLRTVSARRQHEYVQSIPITTLLRISHIARARARRLRNRQFLLLPLCLSLPLLVL